MDQLIVVVPVRNEEVLLPPCLDALRSATAAVLEDRLPPVVRVVVVADSCTDLTAEIAVGFGAEVVGCAAGKVGTARAAGVRHALNGFTDAALRRIWIASTDADSRVPRQWLQRQLAAARCGTHLLLGTVDLVPEDRDDRIAHRWREAYHRRTASVPGEGHPHVHGANLGIRADTYVDAGGFPDVADDEDVMLVQATVALRDTVRRAQADWPVLTSARRLGRARLGVAADLAALE